MTLVGLDLDAGRARAVSGPAGLTPKPLAVGDGERDLPLALSLEGRRPGVGRAGLALLRRSPHLACVDFLPYLGQDRLWEAGRHQIDPAKAMALVFERLRPIFEGIHGLALTLPNYLTRAQATKLTDLAKKSKLPALGSVISSLALARIAHAQQPWFGLALIIDVDEFALSWTAVVVDEPPAPRQMRALVLQAVPALGLRAWRDVLLDGIADRCVRQTRRDPRESAVAEQALYDQLDGALDVCRRGKMVELTVQSAQWFQNLILPPAELALHCRALVAVAVSGLRPLLSTAQSDGPPEVLLASAAVARLPGLLPELQRQLGEHTRTVVLPGDATAQAVHQLAELWKAKKLAAGHIEAALPLARAAKSDAPVRRAW